MTVVGTWSVACLSPPEKTSKQLASWQQAVVLLDRKDKRAVA